MKRLLKESNSQKKKKKNRDAGTKGYGFTKTKSFG